jgi:hypothetical protein
MIEVTRSLVRQLRAVFRRAGVAKTHGSVNQPVIFRAGSDGLRIQTCSGQVALEYHQLGKLNTQELVVPHDLLAASEGRTEDAITLQSGVGGGVLASWNDHGIPQIREFGPMVGSDATKSIPAAPELFEPNSPELSVALHAAAAITERERIRYALDCLQLRGREGKIVATDGHQILVQSGFRFPWADDLLVPASHVFSAREFSRDKQLGVGIIEDWVAFRVGPWTIWLRIDREGRFPKIDDLIHDPDTAIARLSIDSLDAAFLEQTLMRLPVDDVMHWPITLELNSQVLVRAKGGEQTRATELVLSRSAVRGENLTVNSNREYLARAIKLGFREICFFGPTAPVQCDDGRRQYIWALLDSDGTVRASEDVIRIESSQHLTSQQTSHPKLTRRRSNVTHAIKESTNLECTPETGRATVKAAPAESTNSPVGQAIALREALRQALTQTNELIRALKREKRQSRLVASTLASLKQLQKVA